MCRKCNFWIEQNDALIKINVALGERNQALEKVCDEIDHGDIIRVLGRLDPTQLKAVRVFAECLLKDDSSKE